MENFGLIIGLTATLVITAMLAAYAYAHYLAYQPMQSEKAKLMPTKQGLMPVGLLSNEQAKFLWEHDALFQHVK